MGALFGPASLNRGSRDMKPFRTRLSDSALPLLLDGATGTELTRRGIDTSLPLWSAAALRDAPEVVRQIHADYVTAGAEVVIANTFRTHGRSLVAAGLADQAAQWTALAVELARDAAQGRAYVAGSQAPLEDCYEPQRTPPEDALAAEHAAMADHLAAAGVDLILVETQPTIREAVAAATAAIATGLPVLVSFVCGSDGRLFSGETVADAVAAVRPLSPDAILVNCCPAPQVGRLLQTLAAAAPEIPRGAYANIGEMDPVQGWRTTGAEAPQQYADWARQWLSAGAQLIGGCCGTTPEHIRRLRNLLDAAAESA